MADLLSTIRAEIDDRLHELEPALAEYQRLSSVAEALTVEPRAGAGAEAGAVRMRKPAGDAVGGEEEPDRSDGPEQPAEVAKPPKARARRVGGARTRERPADGPSVQAILAALEHGSHTVAELVIVTALPASEIRQSARRLLGLGAITKTEREGKSAYALADRMGA